MVQDAIFTKSKKSEKIFQKVLDKRGEWCYNIKAVREKDGGLVLEN